MKIRSFVLPFVFTLLVGAQGVPAATWFVSATGDDAKDGKSAENAFRSLQKAGDLVQPGDTVLVGDGVYTNADTGEDSSVLHLKRSGKPDAWITWKAAPGAHPDVRPIGWNGILIASSYNIIDGLAVTGTNDSIVFAKALADGLIKEKNGKKYPGDPAFNTNGIFVIGRKNGPNDKPHHNIIRHCTVSKCPGGGIVGIETDYLTIEDNIVFENAWYMRYGGSGITTLTNWCHDDAPGYHIIIQRNQVWDNRTNVPWAQVARLSDGNGILLDVSETEPEGANNPTGDVTVKPAATPTPTSTPSESPKPPRPEWKGRSLIANNVCSFNGGSGIHTFRYHHADIINNTTYWNGNNVGYPELFANNSEDIVILNNVIVPRPKGAVTSNNKNKNIRWDYNLSPEKQTSFPAANDIVGDPLLVKPARDQRNGDFRLQPGSPGLDSGTNELAQPADVVGHPRPGGKGRDRGAFEQ